MDTAEKYANEHTKDMEQFIPAPQLYTYRLTLQNAYMAGVIEKLQEQVEWFREYNKNDDDDDDDKDEQKPVNPDPVKDFINNI